MTTNNTALQHRCDINSNGCNIVPTLQCCVAQNIVVARIRIFFKPHTFYTIPVNPITKTAFRCRSRPRPHEAGERVCGFQKCPDSSGNGLSSSQSRVPESGPWRKALLLRSSWRRPGIWTLATQPPGINFIKRFKCSFFFPDSKTIATLVN